MTLEISQNFTRAKSVKNCLYRVLLLRVVCSLGKVLPLENEMKRPEKFRSTCGVLNAAMTPIAILYSVVGLFGYMKYGENTKGSITLNLPEHETWVIFLKLVVFTFFFFLVSRVEKFDFLNNIIVENVSESRRSTY